MLLSNNYSWVLDFVVKFGLGVHKCHYIGDLDVQHSDAVAGKEKERENQSTDSVWCKPCCQRIICDISNL